MVARERVALADRIVGTGRDAHRDRRSRALRRPRPTELLDRRGHHRRAPRQVPARHARNASRRGVHASALLRPRLALVADGGSRRGRAAIVVSVLRDAHDSRLLRGRTHADRPPGRCDRRSARRGEPVARLVLAGSTRVQPLRLPRRAVVPRVRAGARRTVAAASRVLGGGLLAHDRDALLRRVPARSRSADAPVSASQPRDVGGDGRDRRSRPRRPPARRLPGDLQLLAVDPFRRSRSANRGDGSPAARAGPAEPVGGGGCRRGRRARVVACRDRHDHLRGRSARRARDAEGEAGSARCAECRGRRRRDADPDVVGRGARDGWPRRRLPLPERHRRLATARSRRRRRARRAEGRTRGPRRRVRSGRLVVRGGRPRRDRARAATRRLAPRHGGAGRSRGPGRRALAVVGDRGSAALRPRRYASSAAAASQRGRSISSSAGTCPRTAPRSGR